MIAIKGSTLQYVWPIMVRKIMDKGELVLDERGQKTKELMNMFVTTNDPLITMRPENYPLGNNAMEIYRNQMISPDKGKFVYTYGERLRKHFDINQIEEAINRLKDCKESRRAISVTWDPSIDAVNDEVPCMMYVDFKIRNDKLHITAGWRSHDIFGAYPANYFALLDLAIEVTNRLNVNMGSITTQSMSAHIYEHNSDEAKRC